MIFVQHKSDKLVCYVNNYIYKSDKSVNYNQLLFVSQEIITSFYYFKIFHTKIIGERYINSFNCRHIIQMKFVWYNWHLSIINPTNKLWILYFITIRLYYSKYYKHYCNINSDCIIIWLMYQRIYNLIQQILYIHM